MFTQFQVSVLLHFQRPKSLRFKHITDLNLNPVGLKVLLKEAWLVVCQPGCFITGCPYGGYMEADDSDDHSGYGYGRGYGCGCGYGHGCHCDASRVTY